MIPAWIKRWFYQPKIWFNEGQKTPAKYEGKLRVKCTPLDGALKIEWWDEVNRVAIWTETIKHREDHSFVAQIACTGTFAPSGGYYIDEDGLRHHVLKCDPGQLGVMGQRVKLMQAPPQETKSNA